MECCTDLSRPGCGGEGVLLGGVSGEELMDSPVPPAGGRVPADQWRLQALTLRVIGHLHQHRLRAMFKWEHTEDLQKDQQQKEQGRR